MFMHVIPAAALLLNAQFHNATQLSSWCLYFICTNFMACTKLESFSMLKDENLDHVTTHRWPPVSYEGEMDKYLKEYKDDDEMQEEVEEVEEEGESWIKPSLRFKDRVN